MLLRISVRLMPVRLFRSRSTNSSRDKRNMALFNVSIRGKLMLYEGEKILLKKIRLILVLKNIPCVPGIVAFINKEINNFFFSSLALLELLKLVIHQKFKAQAPLPASITCMHTRASKMDCFCK